MLTLRKRQLVQQLQPRSLPRAAKGATKNAPVEKSRDVDNEQHGQDTQIDLPNELCLVDPSIVIILIAA